VIPLIDDNTDPQNQLFRAGVDLVTGMYFNSPDDGWVVTAQGDNSSGPTGGAIFKATSTAVTSVIFGGLHDQFPENPAPGTTVCFSSAGGGLDFNNLVKTSDGFFATSDVGCAAVQSHDGGKTFKIEQNAVVSGDPAGNSMSSLQETPAGTIMAVDDFWLTTPGRAGPTANWTTVWSPESIPTEPDPLLASDCQEGFSLPEFKLHTRTYISPTGDLMAYAAYSQDNGPEVCVSKGSATDGGFDGFKHFKPHVLPDIVDDDHVGPSGIAFANDKVGIAFYANYVTPSAYVWYTTNGGDTWKSATLPASIKTKPVEFRSAFFAPDGQHVWIVGLNQSGFGEALMIKSADGGATWDANQGDLAGKAATVGGIGRIVSGFALDANHIWVGGDSGLFMSNSAGGI
jgi:hypothetical protein